MALIEGRNRFRILNHTSRFSVIVPEAGIDWEKPVLWLLPASSGLHSDWVRFTHVERWAGELGIAVVMPEGLRSDFSDMVYGMRWWQYISDELPGLLENSMGIPSERCCAFGAGMGGLGALKLALRQPERFCAAGAVRVPLDQFEEGGAADGRRLESIYGTLPLSEELLAESDPLTMAEKLTSYDVPEFYLEQDAICTDRLATSLRNRGACVKWIPPCGDSWEEREMALRAFLTDQYGLMP